MRFTRFRSQRNATGIFLKAEAALEQPRKVCAARLSRRKPKPPTEQPRESARGCEPSRTPSPRGCRGAERPTPASPEAKAIKRIAPAPLEIKSSNQNSPRPVGNQNPRPNNSVPSEIKTSKPEQFPAPSETKLPANPSPGERERVITLSHPSPEGGVGEQSAPRSRLRKPNSSKKQPASSGTQIPARPTPGERERV